MQRYMTLLLAMVLMVTNTGSADIIHLKGGGKLEGRVQDKGEAIMLEMVRGKMSIPKTQINRIEKKHFILDDYDERAAKTSRGDLDANLELGRWCVKNGLRARARKHYAAALALDVKNEEALNYLTEGNAKGKPEGSGVATQKGDEAAEEQTANDSAGEQEEAEPMWGKSSREVAIGPNEIVMRIRAGGGQFTFLPFKKPFKGFVLRFKMWIERLDDLVHFKVRFRSNFQEGKQLGLNDNFCAWRFDKAVHQLLHRSREAGYGLIATHDLKLPLRRWIPAELTVKDNFAQVKVANRVVLSGTFPGDVFTGSGVYFVLHSHKSGGGTDGEAKIKDIQIKPID